MDKRTNSDFEKTKTRLLKDIHRLREKTDKYKDLYHFNQAQLKQAVSKYNEFLKKRKNKQ